MKHKGVKSKIILAVVLVALFAGLLCLLFSGDNKQVIEDVFGGAPLNQILQDVQQLGWRGMVVFGVLSMLQVVLTFLPAEPVQVIAGISYGLWIGAAICVAGIVIGNTVIYLLYRVYGNKLSEYFKSKLEVDFDVLRSSKRVSLVIFILYLLPAIPYGLICFFTASLKTKYPKYIILTTLGSIPSVFIGVALGHLATDVSWVLSLVILAVLIAVIVVLYCNRTKVFEKINKFAKKQFNYTSRTKVRTPGKALSAVIFGGMKTWLNRRIKCKVDRTVQQLQRPAIVLCNHGAFIDFLYMAMLLHKDKPHIVSNRQYFYEKRLGNLLKRLGCIPKSMFATDFENVRNCLQVVKDNGVLVICPEARLSTAGQFEDIQPGTLGFVRKAGADAAIYIIKFGGDYLAMPKWARTPKKRLIRKKSVVEARLYMLYDKGQSMSVSLDEFTETVTRELDYNDFDWLQAHPDMHYPQGNLAVGIDNILYRCPKCGSEFTLTGSGNTVKCGCCNYSATMDDRYRFTDADAIFDNHQQWYNWQADVMRKQIADDAAFELRDRVQLYHSSIGGAKQLRLAGNGTCVLNRDGLTYTGDDSGEQITKFFPITSIYRLLFGAGEDFEIYEGEEIWYFVPDDKRTCVKWYMASILLKEATDEK